MGWTQVANVLNSIKVGLEEFDKPKEPYQINYNIVIKTDWKKCDIGEYTNYDLSSMYIAVLEVVPFAHALDTRKVHISNMVFCTEKIEGPFNTEFILWRRCG